MLENLNNEQKNRLVEFRLHEDEMFNSRLNFFLVFESILLGVVGLLYGRPAPTKLVLIAIICLGVALTSLWGYVQARQKYVHDIIKLQTREVLPEIKMLRSKLDQRKWPLSNTSLLAYGVPIIVELIWIVLLISVAFA